VSSSLDPVSALASLQKASGSFEWGAVLELLLCRDQKAVTRLRPASTDSDEVWTTALVVRLLELRFGDQSQLWQLVVDKARRRIEDLVGDDRAKEVFDAADAVIGASS
jgi:hypothetical protein